MLSLSRAYAVLSRKFSWVILPHWQGAIEAAAVLPHECLVAEVLKVSLVHGNSLGLTSKSPLTCHTYGGRRRLYVSAVHELKPNAVGGRESRAAKF
jgi:hypothetical protein